MRNSAPVGSRRASPVSDQRSPRRLRDAPLLRGVSGLAGQQAARDGRLHLHRWCQWISVYHPAGVYDGEEGKLNDWNASLPACLKRQLLPALVLAHRPAIVIEAWHTRRTLVELVRPVRRKRNGVEHPDFAQQLRHEPSKTAARFMWHRLIGAHIARMLLAPVAA